MHLLDVRCVVTSLNWVQAAEKHDSDQTHFYNDRSAEFLQKLYAYNKAYGTSTKQVEEVADDFKKMKGQKKLNILAIGMEVGMVHLHSFGMFPTGYLDLNGDDRKDEGKVLSVTLSSDFRILAVILESKDEKGEIYYSYKSYSIPLLYENVNEMKIVALKYGQISSLLTYLSSTIRAISEAWEDILLEVDTKIHNYALEKCNLSEGSISDDFLELLMFGNPSDSLEKFLLHDLTESGLKKFGHSIELSYSNIQKLVLKRLQSVAFSLFYHLNDWKGMALWHEKFGALGLSESAVNDAVLAVGSFLLKAIEIQQVIDNSMKNFKAFFRWLYSVILRLSDEPIPFEIGKLTQQDLQFVAEFLRENFTFDDESKKTTVKLERVAQYLKKDDLAYPAAVGGNPWIKFLQDHPTWKETGTVFPYYPEKSLISQYTDLRHIIDVAVKGPWSVMKNTMTERNSYFLYKSSSSSSQPFISHISCPEADCLYTIVTNQAPPCDNFYLIREFSSKRTEIDVIGVEFNELSSTMPLSCSSPAQIKNNYKILDVKFYNEETISVLLKENMKTELNCPVLLQLALKPLCAKMVSLPSGSQIVGQNVPIVDAGHLVEKSNYKSLENIKALKMAVSGSRKVACVLFTSGRQIRLFEMDVEEEEEEEFEGEHEDSVMRDTSMENSAFDMEAADSEKPKEA